MSLKAIGIEDRGVPNKERLHLQVLADTQLCYYAIFDTVILPEGKVFARPKNTYWFTEIAVKAGDHVILFTGPGLNAPNKRTDGFTDHVFHWGQKNTLWAASDACAVIISIREWDTAPA